MQNIILYDIFYTYLPLVIEIPCLKYFMYLICPQPTVLQRIVTIYNDEENNLKASIKL